MVSNKQGHKTMLTGWMVGEGLGGMTAHDWLASDVMTNKMKRRT